MLGWGPPPTEGFGAALTRPCLRSPQPLGNLSNFAAKKIEILTPF